MRSSPITWARIIWARILPALLTLTREPERANFFIALQGCGKALPRQRSAWARSEAI